MRKIAVVTGTRAEYGLLTPVMRKIAESDRLELQVYLTGMHLLEQYGSTKQYVHSDRWPQIYEVPMYDHADETKDRLTRALARGVFEFGRAFTLHQPDLLLILGDRFEPLAATLAAMTLNLPIAHIHGGDRIDSGHIDENIRHMLTKAAHLHFAASPLSADRILKMGEESHRVHTVGAPGVDVILNTPLPTRSNLEERLGLPPHAPFILCAQHPVSLEQEYAGIHYRRLLEVLRDLKMEILLIQPNNDEGSVQMLAVLEEFRDTPHFHIFPSLSHPFYLAALKHCEFLIGNTSSGMLETPAFGKPFIHVGTRNLGRDHAENVLFVSYDKEDISQAVKRMITDEALRCKLSQKNDMFGDGRAAERIVSVLEQVELDEALLKKKLTY